MSVEFLLLSPDAKMPVRSTSGAAGYDLYALETRTVTGGEGSVLIPTGIAVKIPAGHYARIAPRSGLALKEHIAVNAGVVDADYFPNSVGVILYGTKIGYSYTIAKGDRFAQLIIEAIHTPIYRKDSDPSIGQSIAPNSQAVLGQFFKGLTPIKPTELAEIQSEQSKDEWNAKQAAFEDFMNKPARQGGFGSTGK